MADGTPMEPDKALLKLAKLGVIASIEVQYRQTGTDTGETFVIIKGWHDRRVEGLWEEFKPYLSVHVGYNSVAFILPSYLEQVDKWRVFREIHAKDYAEYKRLKAKFEGGGPDGD